MRTSVSRSAIGIPFVVVRITSRSSVGLAEVRFLHGPTVFSARNARLDRPTVTGAPWSVRQRARPSSAAVGDAADLVHVDVDHVPGTAGGALVRGAVVPSGGVRVTTPVDVQSSQQRPTAAGLIAMPPSARSLAVSRTDHGPSPTSWSATVRRVSPTARPARHEAIHE